ncbi:SemiSWEET family sugar transporter [Kitasatospora mediocidica]|uniref:SemiSWEET family sugar transporter n=1 Tax=Kitasatospora mediocidica TaxID=58352 RepID=UPI00069122F7|nr:SemiSWEET family transporter [Kitasatospora mediocidica]
MIVIGLVAGWLVTACWLPQLYKFWRTRSAKDFSWGYLAAFSTGIALWLLYGFLTHDIALVVSNSLTLTLTLAVIGLKLWLETGGANGNTTVQPTAAASTAGARDD